MYLTIVLIASPLATSLGVQLMLQIAWNDTNKIVKSRSSPANSGWKQGESEWLITPRYPIYIPFIYSRWNNPMILHNHWSPPLSPEKSQAFPPFQPPVLPQLGPKRHATPLQCHRDSRRAQGFWTCDFQTYDPVLQDASRFPPKRFGGKSGPGSTFREDMGGS